MAISSCVHPDVLSLSVDASREGWLAARTFSGERMLKMTRRIGRLSGLIAAGVAIVGTGSGVMAASYSAFSANTQVTANSWNTGNVHLTNDIGTAMFTGTNQQMNAGVTTQKCVTVTSDGSLASTVKFYAGSFSDTNSLGSHINLTVNVGSGSTNAGTCAGFTQSSQIYTGTLAALGTGGSSHTTYASGILTSWAPTGTATETKQFQFIWSYDTTTPMSSTASAVFTWETQGS
jgi:hypothetical protein